MIRPCDLNKQVIHGTYIYMYINAIAKSVILHLHLRYNFYKIVLK